MHRADADEYAEYIRATGFAEYGQTPGNVGAWLLRHDNGDHTEFVQPRLPAGGGYAVAWATV